MMIRWTQIVFAAAALCALTVLSLTSYAAHAFTMENLHVGSDGGSRYADPDDRVKNFGQGQGYQPFGPGGPTMQFNQGQSPMARPFSGPRGYVPPSPSGGNNN
jgi:hypothetical protein